MKLHLPLPFAPHHSHHHLNHPRPVAPPHPPPPSMEKLSSTKLVPGAKKVGDRWSNPSFFTLQLGPKRAKASCGLDSGARTMSLPPQSNSQSKSQDSPDSRKGQHRHTVYPVYFSVMQHAHCRATPCCFQPGLMKVSKYFQCQVKGEEIMVNHMRAPKASRQSDLCSYFQICNWPKQITWSSLLECAGIIRIP